MRRTLLALFVFGVSFSAFARTLRAQSVATAVRLTSPAAKASTTDQATIDLQGTAALGGDVKNVV